MSGLGSRSGSNKLLMNMEAAARLDYLMERPAKVAYRQLPPWAASAVPERWGSAAAATASASRRGKGSSLGGRRGRSSGSCTSGCGGSGVDSVLGARCRLASPR